jgi:hypothetical protein
MRRTLWSLTVLRLSIVAACAWTLFASAPYGQTQQTPTGIIAGRVRDAAGNPVPAVVVSARTAATGVTGPPGPPPVRPGGAAEGALTPVLTDERGRFVFTNLPAGRYDIVATRSGWLPGAHGRRRPGGGSEPIDLEAGERRNDLAITMWRPAVIAGRVTADNGDPLIGAEVRAIPQVFIAGRRQSETPIRQKTDDRGMYRFANLMPGEYLVAVLASVLAEPPGFAGAIRASAETPRAYLQTMTAAGAAPILFSRATGVTGGDRPLVGSLSTASGLPDGDVAWPIYPTTFHPSGRLMSSAEVVRAVSGEPRTAVDVQVRLTPTWQISGLLTDPDGPAAWHAVHLVPAESPERPLVDVSTAVTDASGAFTLYGVPSGQYIVRVVRTPWPADPGARLAITGGTGQIPSIGMTFSSRPTGAPSMPREPVLQASQSVTVGNGHVRGLQLTLREGPRVRGRVHFEGSQAPPAPAALESIWVLVQSASGSPDLYPFVPRGQVSADGQFAAPVLWPGRSLIRATAPPGWTFKNATHQGRDVSDAPLEITADLDQVVITFTGRSPTIAGTVQADGGESVEGAVVLLFPVDPSGWMDYGRESRRVASAEVDRLGGFRLAAPPNGDYHLVAIPGEQADRWRDPAVLARLATVAQRIRIGDADPGHQSLRLRRVQ